MARIRLLSTLLKWLLSVGLLHVVLIGWPAMVSSDGGDSSLIHACVNPSNLARIVEPNEACRPSERSVHWPAALPKDVGSQGGAPVVVDKAGKIVGPLIRPDAVVLTASGERLVVGIRPDGFFGLLGVAIYFREPNCSGERLVSPSTDMLLPYVQVVGSTGYFGGRESQPYAVGSVLWAPSSAVTPVCKPSASPSSMNLTPAKTVDLGGFTPPFSVK